MRFLLRALPVLLALLAGLAGLGWWWLGQPLRLQHVVVTLDIAPGAAPRAVAQAAVQAGVQTDARLLYAWFRLSGQAAQIKAGSYRITPDVTPRTLLEKLVRGGAILQTLTIVEGWDWSQVRAALARAPFLRPDSATMQDADIMAGLGRPDLPPEGRFFPETYAYARGSSDLALLHQALHMMEQHLRDAWAQRSADVALADATEALILASIIEKETGLHTDRAQISGVFHNRLRRGMLLQTDPSVIYGVRYASGAADFDGRLRKRDLQTDTPWNTYTRAGLPPTPIAMPGKAALLAAVQPATTGALYFVARGDGSSHFSSTLAEHNRAVNRYLRAPARAAAAAP